MTELSLSVRIFADAARYVAGMAESESRTRRWSATLRSEAAAVRDSFGGVAGQITALAGGVTALSTLADSARLDKSLTGVKLNASATRQEIDALREDFFRMAKDSGRGVNDLHTGFNNLVAMGQEWKSAREQIRAVNTGMAVTSASADKLTSALGVAGEAFRFDLAKPGMALSLLDKMTVAGRKGNAELENLSDIFARVGVNASSAGMGFEKSLAFIEVLSLVERQPERLATLADSTLRLFNNANYRKEAEKATGVKFFDHKGSRRDALAVLADLKKQFDKLKTDAQRDSFMNKAFGKADLDTLKGMRILLSGDSLSNADKFTREIEAAGGTLSREYQEAISNAVDQTGRLKAALREAADGFARPINEGLSNLIKYAMNSKEQGGLALSGTEMIAGGAGLAAGGLLAARYGGGLVASLLGKGGNLAAGVATGAALEEAAGVQSVFVVNMPASGLPGVAGAAPAGASAAAGAAAATLASKIKVGAAMAGGLPLKEFLKLGPAAIGTTAAATAAAGAAGYGVGTGIYKLSEGTAAGDAIVSAVGGGITRLFAALGDKEAQHTLTTVRKAETDKQNTALATAIPVPIRPTAPPPRPVNVNAVATPPVPPLRVSNSMPPAATPSSPKVSHTLPDPQPHRLPQATATAPRPVVNITESPRPAPIAINPPALPASVMVARPLPAQAAGNTPVKPATDANAAKTGEAMVQAVSSGLTKLMNSLGNNDTQRSLAIMNRIRETEIKGSIDVKVHSAPGVQTTVSSKPANAQTSLNVGRTMDGVR